MIDHTELFWNNLLSLIEERTVVPVIGQELSRVKRDGTTVPLGQFLAEELVKVFKLSLRPPEAGNLNQVVSALVAQGCKKGYIYSTINSIFQKAALEPPESIVKLARIRHFTFFVTTNYDTMLSDAVNRERHGGAARTVLYAYSPSRGTDLPDDLNWKAQTSVFHLMGKHAPTPDYALTEEDLLEYIYAMTAESRPNRLFDHLRSMNLLFLGCNYPDWLSRFFIRLLKAEKLSVSRDRTEIVADETVLKDTGLVQFLRAFSQGTEIYTEGSTNAFIDTLYEKWFERNGEERTAPQPAPVPAAGPGEMLQYSVFISYASEDKAAALRLRDHLEKAGLDVWLDESQLEAGDDYNNKIRRNIKKCSVFIPLISQATEQRTEGFFRREWYYAIDRLRERTGSSSFIFPAVIDSLDFYSERVPEEFRALHWTRVPDGNPPPEFAEIIKKRYRMEQQMSRA